MSTAHQLYGSQAAYDAALPPEDPPEFPDMYWQEKELLHGEDTDLVTFQQFRQSADDCLADMGPDGFLIDLVLMACRSDDMVMRSHTKDLRKKLRAHAGKILEEAFLAAIAKAVGD